MRSLRTLPTVLLSRSFSLSLAFVFAFISLLAAGCGSEGGEVVAPRAQQASAPLTGKADGSDASDTSCQVILRELGRQPGDAGYQTECVDGVCNWVWVGQIEVDAKLSVSSVGLLYRLRGDAAWWQVDGVRSTAHNTPGYARYDVRVHEHLLGPDAGAADVAAAKIDAIPFVRLADGTRLFDHNRIPGAFDNYLLEETSGFGVGYAPNVCQPVSGRISFLGNWDEYLTGELRQGGYLVIDYDLARLPACRATHNGYPAWDTVAYVRFSPGGQLVSETVRTFQTNHGVPMNTADRRELQVEIPAGATSVAIWFKNYSGAGNFCETWDSNLGANYSYPIWPAADDPHCKDLEQWSAINSDMPYTSKATCLDYDVASHHAANYCEFYLSGIGRGSMGHYGIPNGWLEAYLHVGPQQGTLLNAGLWARYRDTDSGQTSERVVLGRQVSGDTWQTGLLTLRTAIQGSGGFSRQVEALAFFIDVRRPSGEVVRLWQSRGGANYGLNDAFGLPTSNKSIPYGNIQYANPASAIFDLQRSCN